MVTKMSKFLSLPLHRLFFLIFIALALPGCAISTLLVDQVAQSVVKNDQDEDDLLLARDASPFYLKLIEGLYKSSPGNANLALSVTSGFTQYAYAFIELEADKIEQKDYKGSEVLRERASKMYARAYHHALRFWMSKYPDFENALKNSKVDNQLQLNRSQVGLLYWSAASLGGWIATAKDQPELIADFPIALRLAQWAWKLDPYYAEGSLAALMASFEWANPNGSKAKAIEYLDQAISYANDKNAGPYVTMAEKVAVSRKDKKMFESLLQKAISIAEKKPNLENKTMKLRALWLLENEDDLIESE